MEEIIIAMLYLYPGAMVDVIRHRFFKRSFRDDEVNESTRIAKYFFFSTVISVVSLIWYAARYNKSVANPADIVSALTGTMEIPKYFVISLIVTLLFTGGLWIVNWALLQFSTLLSQEDVVISDSVDAWHEIVYGDALKDSKGYLILRVTNGGKPQMGFSYFLPERFSDGIILIRQEEVAAALERDKQKPADEPLEIFGPIATYCDAGTGATVEFFDGYFLSKKLE